MRALANRRKKIVTLSILRKTQLQTGDLPARAVLRRLISLCACFLLFLLLNCSNIVSWIGEPVQEQIYRTRGNRIKRQDAQVLLIGDLLALSQRCPEFLRSRIGWLPNYYFLMHGGISGGPCAVDPSNSSAPSAKFFTGCAYYHYLDRNDVSSCRVLIQADPCSGDSPERTIAFGICSKAFVSGSPYPTAGYLFQM